MQSRTNERDMTAVIPRLRDMQLIRRDPWGEDESHPPLDVPTDEPPVGVTSWLVPGLVMATLGLIGIGRPALWTDELATWGVARSSWSEMFALLRWVDAIIGPYYALVHGWAELAGTSDTALRLPSVLAMAGAAALIGALGARLASPRAGLTAGLLFALLPTSSRFAQEARVYAFVVLCAALATYLLVRAVTRPRLWRWLAYLLAVAALGLLHPIALLLLAAHGWVVLAHYRGRTVGWLLAATVGALPALPLLRLGNQQKSQVAWIPPADVQTLLTLPREIFGVAWVGLLVGLLALFSLPLRRPVATLTAWATVPILGLYAAAQVTPLFLPRYLLFTLPAWALLAGVALGRVHVGLTIGTLAVIIALAVPQQLAIREPDGHSEAGHQLAALIADGYRTGDGVVYGSQDPGGSWVARDTVEHYVPANRRPLDLLATRPQRTGGQLAATECADTARCLGEASRLWIVRLGYHGDAVSGLGEPKEILLRQHYLAGQTWHLPGFTLALVTRRPS
ncbi:glycosyltransferase family 39 protein [Micromonospora sp. CPCC 206060]|uniref:glycosyltransferase family 39 protein n=1 Tax=Micromonospora sp. CPCC 206060 TaxID=3122406 RepID=UPI002FF3C2B8